jgi:hypothetical protein
MDRFPDPQYYVLAIGLMKEVRLLIVQFFLETNLNTCEHNVD